MAAATGLVLTKRFTYRGDATEEWSNKYWLTGTPPSSPGAWFSLYDEIAALERHCYTPASVIVSAVGYNDNDEHAHAVWTRDNDVEGTPVAGDLVAVPGQIFAGDQAGMISWKTERKNSRGKWIYLRKYMHGGNQDQTDPDLIASSTHAAYQTFADALFNGNLTGGRRIRSQLQDEYLQIADASWFITTRSLKRRGKRPKAATPSGRALDS